MSFCGAWSLDGRPIAEILGEPERASMRGLLMPTTGEPVEVEEGPLWLAGSTGSIVRDGSGWLGLEGFVAGAGDGDALRKTAGEACAAGRCRLDGHYILLHADPVGRALRAWRDPSGGQRLFFACRGRGLLFSTSIRPLLALLGSQLNEGLLFETGYTDLVHFGDETLWRGVHEILAGYRLSVVHGRLEHRWHWDDLQGRAGEPRALASELKVRLGEAVAASIGRDGAAVVTLSGGIDSASVAALAAEAVGAHRVHAITFEFDDPSCRSEVERASLVCKHLGLGRHSVVRISRRDYEQSIPEILWRSEHFNEWTRCDGLIVSRRLREWGVGKCLTGGGIGSHMAYFEDVDAVLRALPRGLEPWRYWRAAHFGGRPGDWLGRVFPGLEAPAGRQRFRLYLPLAYALHHRGLADLGRFFPPTLLEPALRTAQSPRVRQALEEHSALPLAVQWQRLALSHLGGQIDFSRTERAAQGVGVHKISPAFFASCLPWTYFPFRPKPAAWSPRRALRPGKLLLALAMRGRLPDAVIDQRKDWSTGDLPMSWHERTLALAEPVEIPFTHARGRSVFLAYQSLWRRIFLERPPGREPPAWEELEKTV